MNLIESYNEYWKIPQELNVDKILCIGCGACVDSCPMNVLEMRGQKSSVIRPENCIVCRSCERVCPNAAVKNISCVWSKKPQKPAGRSRSAE